MLHKAVTVRGSAIEGRGLFATEWIPEGAIIWERDPNERHYHISEIRTWPQEKQKEFFSCTYQVGPDLYYGMDGSGPDDADFMNHSCDPNTWFTNDTIMTARRDIQPGEEITYDYVTSEIRETFQLNCRCGSSQCRKIVNRNNLLEFPELRLRYRNHMMSHVVDFLIQHGIN